MQYVNSTSGFHRPRTNFDPDLWGDKFLYYTPQDQSQAEKEAQELKEVVRKELIMVVKDQKERLEYIDAIHRLGVAYHFENEIEENLQSFHNKLYCDTSYEDNLQYVALRFRLLRQHGFYVPCDVFNKFKSDNGGFKDSLASDVEGILNLYEASFLGVHGEDTLDEALAFCTTHLKAAATQLNSHITKQILHTLKIPLHRRSPRLESRHQISFYESRSSNFKTLLKFSKLDFNLTQALHNLELRDITRWSRSFDMTIRLPAKFMRDRIVEGFYWSLGAYYEPKYSLARQYANKLFRVISVVDDLYDAYATTEELEIFTEAIQRWNKNFTTQLPEYMQFFYDAIIDLFEEFEQDFTKEGRPYVVYYAKQALTNTCKAYLKEATWRRAKIVPTYDEHLENSIHSTGYLYIIVVCFMGMGKIATKEAFEWVNENSIAPKATCIMTRLLDDLADHKKEQQREHVSSSVECYMAQFGTTEQEAYEKIQSRIEETWKDINQASLRPAIIAKTLFDRVINLARVLYDFFQIGEDGYTTPKYVKSKIQAVLVDPIMI